MEFLIIGIVSALNLIIIVSKFKRGRVEDAVFDTGLFAFLTIVFSGSYGGMVVAMIGSFIVSLYLLISPPTFFRSAMKSKTAKETIDNIKSTTAATTSGGTDWLKFLGWGAAFAGLILASFIAIPALIIIGLVALGGGIYKVLNAEFEEPKR
jgi:hypothetical protein